MVIAALQIDPGRRTVSKGRVAAELLALASFPLVSRSLWLVLETGFPICWPRSAGDFPHGVQHQRMYLL